MRAGHLKMHRILPVVLSLMAPAAALAQSGPCELDANGELYCYSNNNPNMLESTCLTSADPNYCLPYHQRVPDRLCGSLSDGQSGAELRGRRP